MNLLIVEDDEGVARVLRTVLQSLNADITRVSTMRDARQELYAKQYDVILLDLGLPDSTTDETLSLIKPLKATHNVAVCVITGQMGQSEQTAKIAGADGFIHKVEMLTPHRLIQIISGLFSEHSPASRKLDVQTELMKQAVDHVIKEMND
jgi:two-component system response regulator HydG